jgi:hypothetical protein
MSVMFMLLQKLTYDDKFQICVTTLSKLTIGNAFRLQLSGTKIIQIFIVISRFNHP